MMIEKFFLAETIELDEQLEADQIVEVEEVLDDQIIVEILCDYKNLFYINNKWKKI